MANEIGQAPRDRALDPSRSIGSGPSMGRTLPAPGSPKPSTPKFGGDPGFNGPGSLKPTRPNDKLDPGFSRGKVKPPKMNPGITSKPMPYTGPIGGAKQDPQPYRGPIGGTTKTLPYYPQG